MLVLANIKKAKKLQQEKAFWNTLTLKLFTNNYTPVAGMNAAAFTECADGGYASVTNVGFTDAVLNGSNQAELAAPAVTFTFNYSGGTFTVYGAYWIDPADGEVVAAERAASPFTVTASGQIYVVNPKTVMDTMP